MTVIFFAIGKRDDTFALLLEVQIPALVGAAISISLLYGLKSASVRGKTCLRIGFGSKHDRTGERGLLPKNSNYENTLLKTVIGREYLTT